jgi:hypothetical protein
LGSGEAKLLKELELIVDLILLRSELFDSSVVGGLLVAMILPNTCYQPENVGGS